MAKEQDQTQQTEEDTTKTAEVKEDTTAVDKAVKTSEDFDKLVDANPEDVEDTPSEEKDDTSKDSKDSETKDDSKADDKDTGKDDTEDSEKDNKDTKNATDTGESNISKEVAQKALDSGLSEEEIDQFDSDEELEKFVGIIESVMSEEDEKIDTTQKPDEKKTEDDSVIKFENESEIDPEILKGIRSLEKDNKELREEVRGLVGGMQQQQDAAFLKRFDGMVTGLGKEFADTFGIGSTDDLGRRSMAFKNRASIGKRMRAFGRGMVDAKISLPDEQELFDLAVNSLHKKKLETVKGLRLGKKTTARSKQRIGRAASKSAGNLTGQQKAVETSRKFDDLIDTTEDTPED